MVTLKYCSNVCGQCAVSFLSNFGALPEKQILLPLVDDIIVLRECPQTVTKPNLNLFR